MWSNWFLKRVGLLFRKGKNWGEDKRYGGKE